MRDKKQIAKRMILAVAMTLPSLAGQIGAGVATATILSPLAANAHPREFYDTTMAAMKACAEEKGLPTPGDGQRPTQEQKQAMRVCLSENGIELPERHRGDGHQENSSPTPAPPPSVNPADPTTEDPITEIPETGGNENSELIE